jgi:hypothetical protein
VGVVGAVAGRRRTALPRNLKHSPCFEGIGGVDLPIGNLFDYLRETGRVQLVEQVGRRRSAPRPQHAVAVGVGVETVVEIVGVDQCAVVTRRVNHDS